MNFLADESIDAPIVRLLCESGYQVQYIAEMTPGVSDTVVLELANRDACPLITADKDFGELVFRQQRLMHGIVLVRLAGMSPQQKASIVLSVVRDHGDELIGAFTVVSKTAVRVRRLN